MSLPLDVDGELSNNGNDPPLYYGPLPQRYATIIQTQQANSQSVVSLTDPRHFFCSHFGFTAEELSQLEDQDTQPTSNPSDHNSSSSTSSSASSEDPPNQTSPDAAQTAHHLLTMKDSILRPDEEGGSTSTSSQQMSFRLPPLSKNLGSVSGGLPRISQLLGGSLTSDLEQQKRS